jgi:CelD/BcsL family acetyltransferase involved in cellulose biosynthesis
MAARVTGIARDTSDGKVVPRVDPPAPNHGHGSALWVEVARSTEQLSAHLAAWEALARGALEPNVFYEPWMLVPALSHLRDDASTLVVFVYRQDAGRARQSPMLCGVFPLERRRLTPLPIAVLALWRHRHCFLCTPLLHPGHAREAMGALFEWARTGRDGVAVLDFSLVHGEGPFQQALLDCLNDRDAVMFQRESYNRAMLRRHDDGAEAYLAAALAPRRRKELRRQRRRLAELGRLESRALGGDGDVAAWIAWFLTLEASGWKGETGSALGCRPDDRAYFTAIARAAFARGQLRMLGIFLDGRPIALKCNLGAGRGSFAFKIAFDAGLARYSPGVQLEIDNIEALHRSDVDWMDSCAVPQHPMIDRLWRERRTIQSVLIGTRRGAGELVLGALPMVRAVRRFLRGAAAPSSRIDRREDVA